MWIEELNKDGRPVILNSGSGYAARLDEDAKILKSQGENAVMLWVMEQGIASVELLEKFLARGVNTRACLVKNGFWGEEDDFKALNESRFATAPAVYLPKCDMVVTRAFFNESIPFGKMKENLNAGELAFFDMWLEKAMACIEEALGKAARLS